MKTLCASEVVVVAGLLLLGEIGSAFGGFLLPTITQRTTSTTLRSQQEQTSTTTSTSPPPPPRRRQYFTQNLPHNKKRRKGPSYSKRNPPRQGASSVVRKEQPKHRRATGLVRARDVVGTATTRRNNKIDAPELFELFGSSSVRDVTKDEDRTLALKGVRNYRALGTILESWARAPRTPDAGDRCQNVLKYLRKHKVKHLRLNTYVWNLAINAYARRKQAVKAETLLRELLSVTKANGGEFPNARSFGTVMNAWSKSNADDAPEQCKRLLGDVLQLASSTGRAALIPNSAVYNIMIDAHSSRGQAKEAEDMLRWMIANSDASTREGKAVIPNIRTFNSVMMGWSRSDADDAPEQCKRLLSDIFELASSTGNDRLAPDVITYNIVIDAHATRGRAKEAEDILNEMLENPQVEPDALSFTSVINAWSKSDATDAPEQCRRLLNKLQSFFESKGGKMKFPPDVVSYTAVINAYATRGRAKEAEEVLKEMVSNKISPNVVTFNSVMDAWSKSEADDAPEQCKRIIDGMVRTSGAIRRQTGEAALEPDAFTYNTLIDAYAVRGRAREAEEILRELLARKDHVFANAVSFAIVMKAWTNSDAMDAPEQCVRLFSELHQLAKKLKRDDLVPEEASYSTLRAVFAKHGRREEAEEYIRNLE